MASPSRLPMSKSETVALSVRDGELAEVILLSAHRHNKAKLLTASGPWPDPPFTDIPQCRSISDYADGLLAKAHEPTPSDLLESKVAIPTDDTYIAQATLTRPVMGTPPGPLMVLFHPGGFFLGSRTKLTTYACALASQFGASVLCPTYRFAPEHPFPTGVEDAWAAVQWAAAHAGELGADATARGFVLGGISSGANFAVVLARRAVEVRLLPLVTGVWAPLFIGCVSPAYVPEEYKEDQGKAAAMWEYYKLDHNSPLFNPLAVQAGHELDLGSMPRTFLQVAGEDLFRDDGLVLSYAMQAAGAEVLVEVYPGVPHSFWVFAPSLKVSQKCIEDMVRGVAWLLGVAVDELRQGWEVTMAAPTIRLG
jgi:acetyl esterase/lipase